MTQPSKKGRSRKMARIISRNKLKVRLKRQSKARYTERTGRSN